jgi:hypothetical protein
MKTTRRKRDGWAGYMGSRPPAARVSDASFSLAAVEELTDTQASSWSVVGPTGSRRSIVLSASTARETGALHRLGAE